MNNAFASLDARIVELEKRPGGPAAPPAIPAGTIAAFGGEVVPEGWLFCDGSAVNRTQHAALFAAIKTSWGAGDGQTTFHLPDLRGVFLRGVSRGTNRDPDRGARNADRPGAAQGDAVGSFQQDQLRQHTHQAGYPVFTVVNLAAGGAPLNYNTSIMTIPTEGANPGGAETRPINAYVSYIIKL